MNDEEDVSDEEFARMSERMKSHPLYQEAVEDLSDVFIDEDTDATRLSLIGGWIRGAYWMREQLVAFAAEFEPPGDDGAEL
jgi:hypothetical protein